jgi:hypothetical protein
VMTAKEAVGGAEGKVVKIPCFSGKHRQVWIQTNNNFHMEHVYTLVFYL